MSPASNRPTGRSPRTRSIRNCRAVIRRAAPQDIPCFNRIDMSYSAPFGYAYRLEHSASGLSFHFEETWFDPPFEREYDWDWTSLDDFAGNVEKGLVWAAFDEAGAAVGLVELRESEWNGSFWIQSLYVDKPARRRGIGAALLEAAVEHARTAGARALFVETQVSNGPAIRFYQTRGFRPCGFNDHFYTNDDARHGEVALFLVRTLPGAG